jgi:hypothetical protein
MIEMQTFLRDGDQHVGRYGNPYLPLDPVLAGAKEHLDAQVLLDPFEEQLHLPALTVQVRDHFRLQGEVVGQKYETFSGVVLDHNPARRCRVSVLEK